MPDVITNCYFDRHDVKVKRTEGNYGERERSVSISGNYGRALNDLDGGSEEKYTCSCSFLCDKICFVAPSLESLLLLRLQMTPWLEKKRIGLLLSFQYHVIFA